MVLVSGILVGAEVSPVEWLFLQEGSTLLGVEESTSRRPRAIGLSPAYPQEKPTWMERAWTAGLEAGWSIPGIAVPASRSSPFPASEISAPIQVSSHPLRVEGRPRLGRVVLVTSPLSGVVEAEAVWDSGPTGLNDFAFWILPTRPPSPCFLLRKR